MKLPPTKVLIPILIICLVLIGVGLLIYFRSHSSSLNSYSDCNTPAGYLEHQQKIFGPCGSDICSSDKQGRPVYSCQDGTVTSACLPDTTCTTDPDYQNSYGFLPLTAGNFCPVESLFGCACATGPGADDGLVVSSAEPCPHRYCYIYNPSDTNCFKTVSYLGDTCPTQRYYYSTDQACQSFYASLSPQQLKELLATANRPSDATTSASGPGGTGGSNPYAIGPPGPELVGPGGLTSPLTNYPTSTLGKLIYQVVGSLPQKTLPSGIISRLPLSTQDKILLIGIDPANPNYTTITSPQTGQSLSSKVTVNGGAVHPDFQFYYLEYASSANPDQWTKITPEITTPVFDDTLGVWDTTSLPSGTYQLRLSMNLSRGRHHFRYVTVGNLKKN